MPLRPGKWNKAEGEYWQKTPRGRGGEGEKKQRGRKREKDEILTSSKNEGSG